MDDNLNLIHYEKIVASKKLDFRKRIKIISDRFFKVFSEYHPDVIVLEEPPIIKNSSASMLLIMNGYFSRISEELNLELKLYYPTEWRSSVGILKGLPKNSTKDIQKESTVKYVNEKFNTNFEYIKNSNKSTDDIADAIGLTCCAIKQSRC